MSYLLFWIRIAARRFVSLFKTSPVVIIGAIVIIAAFIAARNDIAVTLNTQKLVFVSFFFVIFSLLLSFKKYSTMSSLLVYSKSGLQNKFINILFFVKQAFLNNMLLFIFIVISFKGMVKAENPIILPVAALCSLALSLLLMYLKNEYAVRKTSKKTSILRNKSLKIKTYPLLKSAVFDYVTSDFLQTAFASAVLFILITIEIIKNGFSFSTLEEPPILLMGMVVILAVGFLGIIDSIPHLNWKFFSIISPKSYGYHFKTSLLFLTAFFGVLIALFIFIAAFSGLVFLLKYLYCTLVLLSLAVNISFTIGGAFIKLIMFTIAVILTMWISTLHIAFLPLLAVPVLIAFLKAKNEYMEWYFYDYL